MRGGATLLLKAWFRSTRAIESTLLLRAAEVLRTTRTFRTMIRPAALHLITTRRAKRAALGEMLRAGALEARLEAAALIATFRTTRSLRLMKRLRAAITAALRIRGAAAVFRLRTTLLMFSAITRRVHLRAAEAFTGRIVSTAAIFLTRRIGRPAPAIARIRLSAALLVLLTRRVHLRTALWFAIIFGARRIVLRALRFATRLFARRLRIFTTIFRRGRRVSAGSLGGGPAGRLGFLSGQ